MCSVRTVVAAWGLFSLLLLGDHWMNLPVYPIYGWFFHERVTKDAYFKPSNLPATRKGWASAWGPNRPKENRAHEILSEVEVRIQHEIRNPGIVRVTVTGESAADIDAFLAMVNRDAPDMRMMETTPPAGTYYWRQCYLWILIANLTVSIALSAILFRDRRLQKPDAA